MDYQKLADKFGTVTYKGQRLALAEQATPSNRVFSGWWGDAEENDGRYTAEYQASAVDTKGNSYMVYWQFDQIKGQEPGDESDYPFDNNHISRIDRQ